MRLDESFIDEHVDWLLASGVKPRSGSSPFPPVDAAPRAWPTGLTQWYDARLWDRFYELQAVGLANFGRLAPPMSAVPMYDDFRNQFELLHQQGSFPEVPAPVWRDEGGLNVVAETVGSMAGSLYWFDEECVFEGCAGFLSASISEYLAAVRALVDAGVSSPHSEPSWVSAFWERQDLSEPCPPLDTPGPIVGLPQSTIESEMPGLTNAVAPSLAELIARGR